MDAACGVEVGGRLETGRRRMEPGRMPLLAPALHLTRKDFGGEEAK